MTNSDARNGITCPVHKLTIVSYILFFRLPVTPAHARRIKAGETTMSLAGSPVMGPKDRVRIQKKFVICEKIGIKVDCKYFQFVF